MHNKDDSNDCAHADPCIQIDSSHTSAGSDGGKGSDKGSTEDDLSMIQERSCLMVLMFITTDTEVQSEDMRALTIDTDLDRANYVANNVS
jgi:hypothetical protein